MRGIQHEAALAADAATVIYTALTNVSRHSRMFHSSPRSYANATESIDCDAEPLRPWRHGYDVMKALREVSDVNRDLRHKDSDKIIKDMHFYVN